MPGIRGRLSKAVVRAVRLTGLGALVIGALLALGSSAAAGASDNLDEVAATGSDVLDVVEVSGLLDGITADFIERSMEQAAAEGSLGLVLQVNSPRAIVDDERLIELAARIRSSAVPVYMWVGPSGAVATGAVGQLAGVVSDLAVAPGSELGDLGPLIVPAEHLAEPFAEAYPTMQDQTVSSAETIELGLAREAPTLGFFVIDLPGFETEIDTTGDEPVRVPVSPVRFAKLSLIDQFMHTAASPALAYLLLLAGAGLLVFELYTAGVGLAGGLGALSFLLGCYGLAALPARGWAVGLLLVAMFGYGVDIQTGVPRVWTVIATVCLTAGSLTLFDGVSLSWITLLAGIIGVTAGMVTGMPAMVRTRFGTPTIGREWMVGALGVARDPVDPEGVVVIDGAPWRARTQRATPIADGDPIRVMALEGLVLTVEPADEDADEDADEAVGAVEGTGDSEPAG
jgi:membrane-bound serine protease (ClpP class)